MVTTKGQVHTYKDGKLVKTEEFELSAEEVDIKESRRRIREVLSAAAPAITMLEIKEALVVLAKQCGLLDWGEKL